MKRRNLMKKKFILNQIPVVHFAATITKIHVILISCLLLLPASTLAQKAGFTIEGEIEFTKTGNIFAKLVNKYQFTTDGNKKKNPKRGIFIKIGEKELKAKKVSFIFEKVPKGTFGIEVFQDVNGNQKLDFGMFGAKEPWGMYRSSRPGFRAPKFEEIAFEVKQNIKGIKIEVK